MGGAPQGGTGGAAGGGSQTDPMNCGAAGRVCRSQADGACVNGECIPSLSTCAARGNGEMQTCNELCASFGESCARQSCGGLTSIGWLGEDLCQVRSSGGDPLAVACDESLVWSAMNRAISCCCTDTP